MPLNSCPYCEEHPDKPSFKGNQVRGSQCSCHEIHDEGNDHDNVKWHWNPTIGKDEI